MKLEFFSFSYSLIFKSNSYAIVMHSLYILYMIISQPFLVVVNLSAYEPCMSPLLTRKTDIDVIQKNIMSYNLGLKLYIDFMVVLLSNLVIQGGFIAGVGNSFFWLAGHIGDKVPL